MSILSMKITSKGQVTIPQAIREQLELLPGSEVDMIIEGTSVKIVKRKSTSRGEAIVRELERVNGVTMTTDEIMALTRGD